MDGLRVEIMQRAHDSRHSLMVAMILSSGVSKQRFLGNDMCAGTVQLTFKVEIKQRLKAL